MATNNSINNRTTALINTGALQLDTGGVKIKNSAGVLNVRNAADSADANITVAGLTTSANATVGGTLTVTGDLTVNGTTSTVNSTTLNVDDKNIELGSIAVPTDTTADGGGITLKGATDKSIIWDNANSNWTLSTNVNIPTASVYKINNVTVLSATTLGSSVVSSSLTSVGTIATGVWNGTAVGILYGGTGQTTANAALNALLPSQTGNNTKVLQTDGTNTSWQTVAGGSSFATTEVTAISATITVGSDYNTYIANNASLVTLTLPTTCAIGKIIKIVGKGAGGWRIAQSAGQQVIHGTVSSTSGATGTTSSTQQYDSVEVICITANTLFVVSSSQGNPDLV